MADPDDWGKSPKQKRPVSAKQLAANRANARKSTGPKTPEGKAQSSLNPLTHGGYARLDAIDRGFFHEDPADIQAVLDQLWDAFQPSHPLLEQMLLQIARRWIGMRRYDRFEVLRMTDITTNGTDGIDKQALLADIDVLTRAAGLLRGPVEDLSPEEWDVLLTVAAMRDADLADAHARFDPDHDILPADVQAKVLASPVGGHGQSLDIVANALDAMAALQRARLPDPETERRAALDGLRRGHNDQFVHQSARTVQRLSASFQSELRSYRLLEAALRANHPADPHEAIARNEPIVNI